MPIWKHRYDNIKVYRPNGAKYVTAEMVMNSSSATMMQRLFALHRECIDKFRIEFGRLPNGFVTIDTLIVTHTASIYMTLVELPDEE